MAYIDTILAETSLLAYWPLDEPSGTTFADAEGSADLTATGAVTAGVEGLCGDRVSDGGLAAEFAGGRASRAASYTGDLTVEGWFRLDSLAADSQTIFFNGTVVHGSCPISSSSEMPSRPTSA